MASPTDFEATLSVAGEQVLYYSLAKAEAAGFGAFNRLPKSLKVLGENLLRNCDKHAVSEDDIRCLGRWTSDPTMIREVAYHPVRILMPEISGIPLLVDLSAMRDAVHEFGGDPTKINPKDPLAIQARQRATRVKRRNHIGGSAGSTHEPYLDRIDSLRTDIDLAYGRR